MRVLCACLKVAIPQLSQAYNSSHLMRSAFEICRNTRLVYVALDYQKNSGNMQHTQQSVAVSFTFFISLLRSVYVSVAFIRLCSVEMNSRFANWAVCLSALSCLCWMTVGVFVCVPRIYWHIPMSRQILHIRWHFSISKMSVEHCTSLCVSVMSLIHLFNNRWWECEGR